MKIREKHVLYGLIAGCGLSAVGAVGFTLVGGEGHDLLLLTAFALGALIGRYAGTSTVE